MASLRQQPMVQQEIAIDGGAGSPVGTRMPGAVNRLAHGAAARRPPVVLAFHAEKLHEPKVWRNVSRVAQWLADRRQGVTFFVYPFPAAVSGTDISARIAWLGSLGHEIAQHTHFYAGAAIGKKEKVDDLSDANVAHCMERDFALLQRSGCTPRGFSAGAWFVTDAVFDTLVALDFSYDCSAQIPRPKTSLGSGYNRWLDRPGMYRNARGSLLCLPTTCSIGEWFKWGRGAMRDDDSCPRIVYLHDYDLLAWHRRWLLRRWVATMSELTLDPVRTVAAGYRTMEDDCHDNNCNQ